MQFNWNNYTLDGINNNEGNQNNVVVLPNIDAILEFKVLTGIVPAEYGRNSGAQVVVVTKQGSNQVHGTLYEFFRNSSMDAKNYFDPNGPTPAFRQNQFGATMGGPVVIPKVYNGKDKTWFFADAEAVRSVQALTVTNSVVPSSITDALNAKRDVPFDPVFFGSKAIINPLTGLQFPNNTIPYSLIDPVAAKLARGYPTPTNNAIGANYVANPKAANQRWQFDTRLDHRFSDKDTVFGRFSFGNAFINYPYGLPAATVDGVTFESVGATNGLFPGPQDANSRGLSLTETHVASSNVVNVARLGFSRWVLHALNANNSRGDVAARLGIAGVNVPGNLIYSGMPLYVIPGFSPLGDPIAIPLPYVSNVYELNDALSIVHGAHNLKLGGQFQKMQMNIGQVLYPRGYYISTGQYSGNGLADFLLGHVPTIARSYYGSVPGIRNYGMAFFVQDDWRVTNRLTFNLGLRYEAFSPETDSHNRLTNFDIQRGVPVFAGSTTSKTGGVRMDSNNFGPRVGYAYQINSKLVARGGAGVFYNLPLAVGFFNRLATTSPTFTTP